MHAQLRNARVLSGSHLERAGRDVWSHALVTPQNGQTQMEPSIRTLSELVKSAREEQGYTSQEEFALALGPSINRSVIAHLEQARRLPSEKTLQLICEHLKLPSAVWKPLLEPDVAKRVKFESALSELVGRVVSLGQHDHQSSKIALKYVLGLFGTGRTRKQLYDDFCATLIFYGVTKPSRMFFRHYLPPEAFRTTATLEKHIAQYQVEAIRLFASFEEAYLSMSQADELSEIRAPLLPRSDDNYRERTEWKEIEEIPEERLADLGYISASRIKKEQAERKTISEFLEKLAARIEKNGRLAVDEYPEKRRRKIGSLLRKFKSMLAHDLLSPLFAADPDEIRREAKRLAPKEAGDLRRMEETQATGQRNLSCYLAADHLDVYVATSMRSDADFVSVNSFVRSLFGHGSIEPLKLRYFNPTQSWVEDRVAKGLVEALMLRRADFAIYMAQKGDTFGKDSEASVALGQGKPVIVYVPRLYVPELDLDSEKLGILPRGELHRLVESEAKGDDADVDETTDGQALLSQILQIRLSGASEDVLREAARAHWADFDLYGEASRIEDSSTRAQYRAWLDAAIHSATPVVLAQSIRDQLIGIFVAVATDFEKRAKIFREIHPLALQVILSTGVLNGILVTRSVDACAHLLALLAKNELDLRLDSGDDNYRLIENSTKSTMRVISRHRLIMNAFSAFYQRQ